MRCKDTIFYPDSQMLAFLKSVKHFIKKIKVPIVGTFNYFIIKSSSIESFFFVHQFLQPSLEHVDIALQPH